MTVDFEWQDDYLIGVDEIDCQHKRFLKLIKSIYERKRNAADEKEVTDLLDEIKKYAHFHFSSEELLMTMYLYPKHNEQKEDHDKIKLKLNKKIDNLKAHKGELIDLLHFLMKWFIDHTTCLDKDLGEYINKHRTT
ncbi:bacteriohemerythrin [Patescibacteria group bacterium]|nr:bacteriohemerythrin [Patescibacteria group bacterium]